MNLVDGLERIRSLLQANNAEAVTLQTVDAILANAANMHGGGNAKAQSLLQITKMLQRTPAASGNVRIFNDLSLLEQQLTVRADALARDRAAEAEKPMPKTKKFYKEQKERAKAAKQSS